MAIRSIGHATAECTREWSVGAVEGWLLRPMLRKAKRAATCNEGRVLSALRVLLLLLLVRRLCCHWRLLATLCLLLHELLLKLLDGLPVLSTHLAELVAQQTKLWVKTRKAA